jgi:hypothetical protein
MAKTFNITLSDAEEKALASVAVSPLQWIQNAASERARLAIEEIVANEVQRKLAAGETISGTKEDIVLAANIKSAAELQAEYDALRG